MFHVVVKTRKIQSRKYKTYIICINNTYNTYHLQVYQLNTTIPLIPSRHHGIERTIWQGGYHMEMFKRTDFRQVMVYSFAGQQGSHFNFFIVSANIFEGHFKS